MPTIHVAMLATLATTVITPSARLVMASRGMRRARSRPVSQAMAHPATAATTKPRRIEPFPASTMRVTSMRG
jgi:hypothetical protein